MPKNKEYDFGEKKKEKNKAGEFVEPLVTQKYLDSKAKAISLIEKYDFLSTGDFWILKNESKSGAIIYSGMIITHNACEKLNRNESPENRFDVKSMSISMSEYTHGLIYEYLSPEQNLYEVGEVSVNNCKNNYPHAMAFKRLFDRVVLKLTGIAFDDILSESESEELKNDNEKDKSLEQKDGFRCNVCGALTYGTKTRTAKELEQASIEKFGQPLCRGCAEKINETAKVAKSVGDK